MSTLGIIGWTDEAGNVKTEPFNPSDAQHRTLMELFAGHCPECRRALDAAGAALPPEPESPEHCARPTESRS